VFLHIPSVGKLPVVNTQLCHPKLEGGADLRDTYAEGLKCCGNVLVRFIISVIKYPTETTYEEDIFI
jgi:hypothetical protein